MNKNSFHLWSSLLFSNNPETYLHDLTTGQSWSRTCPQDYHKPEVGIQSSRTLDQFTGSTVRVRVPETKLLLLSELWHKHSGGLWRVHETLFRRKNGHKKLQLWSHWLHLISGSSVSSTHLTTLCSVYTLHFFVSCTFSSCIISLAVRKT